MTRSQEHTETQRNLPVVQWTAIIEEHSASSGLIPRTVITFMFADMVDGRIAEALDHFLDNHCPDKLWEAGWNTEHLSWLLPTHLLVARLEEGD